MTVSYQYEVASSTSGGFVRLLFRWRGSVWKLVYREILFFSTSYTILTLLYRYVLTEVQKRSFEKIVYYCSNFMELIPLSFMLGFYVSFTATRWWNQYLAIPWPDKLMNIIAMYVPGVDESSRMMRRTLMRYLNLSLVLVLRSISMAVKRRFPTRDHLVEAGFMTKVELDMFQSVPSTEFNTYWIPCTWFINILRDANKENKISDSNGVKLIMEELNEFRSKCGLLWGYDWISVPLVYTQVVTIATYAFYFACIVGRQYVKTPEKLIQDKLPYDYYFPIFTVLQILFYMGLLKVAEQLINPFGDDDEDFELNWIIDRHMKVSYLGVDTLNGEAPPLVKDSYYDELDVKLPYTEASLNYKKKTYRGSVARMQVPMEQQLLVVPEMAEDEEGQNDLPGMGSRRPSVWSIFGSKLNNSQRPSITGSGLNVQDAIGDAYSDLWKHSTSSFNISSENIAQSNGERKNSSGTGGTQDGENGRESSIAGSQDLSEKMSQWESSNLPHQGKKPCPMRSRSATCLFKQQPQRNMKPYRSLFKKKKPPSLEQHYMDLCRKWNMRSVTPCKKISEGQELTAEDQEPQPSVQITVSSPPSNGEETKRRKPAPPCRSTSLNVGDRSQKPRVYERRQSYDFKRSTSSSSVCSQETVMQEFHSMPNVQEEEPEVVQETSTKPMPTDDGKKTVLSQASREHKISRQNALRMDSREKQESISSSSDDYKVAPEVPTRSSESPSNSISVATRLSGEEKLVGRDSLSSSKEKQESTQEGGRSRKTGTFRRSPARRGRPSSKDQKRLERKGLPTRQYSSDSPTPYTTETSISESSRSSATSTPATSTVVIPDTSSTVVTPDASSRVPTLPSAITTPHRSSSIPSRYSSSNNRHGHTVINIEETPPDVKRDRGPIV